MRILSDVNNLLTNKKPLSVSRGRWLLAVGLTLVCFMLSGCDRNGRFQALSMWNDSRFVPYEPDPFMPNGSSSQTPPAGTVWHGQTEQDKLYPHGTFAPIRDMYAAGITPSYNEGVDNTGPTGDYRVRGAGALMTKFPFPITKEVLLRGQERFDIYCAPCHGRTGYGDGMIVRRGFRLPHHIIRPVYEKHLWGISLMSSQMALVRCIPMETALLPKTVGRLLPIFGLCN